MEKRWYYKTIQWHSTDEWNDYQRVFAEATDKEEAKRELSEQFEELKRKGGLLKDSRLCPVLFGSWKTKQEAEENQLFQYL